MKAKKRKPKTPLSKLADKVDGLREILLEMTRLMHEERTVCSRCGMSWGDHRQADLACPTIIDRDGAHFHEHLKFKPLYS